LYKPEYDGMSSEEIYDFLYKNAKKINISELVQQLLDEHMSEAGQGDANGKDGGERLKLSKEELDQIRDEIKEAVLSAAQTCGANNLPAGIKRMVQALTEPKMNWRELLRMQLESTIKSDYTWMRASRRGWHMDAIMPGMKNSELIDVAVAIDMSGSISQKQGQDFISEVKGIMEAFESYKIHLFSFDTGVYNPQVYDSDNLENISDYDLKGGGGTDFNAIFNYLKDEDIEPKRLVVFTDGYPFGSWGDANYCDTIWIIHGDRNPNPPFGQWALYNENEWIYKILIQPIGTTLENLTGSQIILQ